LGDRLTGHPTQAIICAPVQHKDEVLGTIQAINPVEGTFNQRDLDVLVNLANIASSAIANAQQFARAQAAERRYLNLFQDSISPMILTDMKRTIVEANRRAALFFGYAREELIGTPISNLFPQDVILPDAARIKSGETRDFRSEAFAKEGQPIPVEVYVKQTSFREEAELIQWQYHDLTHQVELEEMRKDLMAMLFHDLQSPLSNVMSSLELMRYEIPPDDDSLLGEMLDIAHRSSNHLQSLIRSLLDIDRLEAGHPVGEQTAVAIHKLFDAAEEMERQDYERRSTRLTRQAELDLPNVLVEEDMIRRVLINLLDNALRYSDGGAEVKILAYHLKEENQVLVSVIDRGPGIPDRFREVIFDKFQRMQRGTKVKGLGIGLAFCRLAVEAHGGRIWVDDAPDGGAQFNLTLPVAVRND
jgi:PAS domain S-box-containing protein